MAEIRTNKSQEEEYNGYRTFHRILNGADLCVWRQVANSHGNAVQMRLTGNCSKVASPINRALLASDQQNIPVDDKVNRPGHNWTG